MNAVGYSFSVVASGMLLALPRRWAPLPLLAGAAYMTTGQGLEIGSLHFPVVRILVAVGLWRVLAKREHVTGGWNRLDGLMILWAVWLVCSSLFHESGVVVTRAGEVFTNLGIYLLFRCFVQSTDDVVHIFKVTCVLLAPVAAEMAIEQTTGKNFFGRLLGEGDYVASRHGRFRAKGPFGQCILAGTVGAVCFPMALYLWRQHRKVAVVGLAATGVILLASASSGPIMALFSVLGAMALWRIRGRLRAIRWLGLVLLLALNVVMQDPVYYLVARVDITGGSTGWYRAALIQSAFDRLGDWWLIGTDVTRGWTHVAINEKHSDITNQYIGMGVRGGLPLMLLFVAILWTGFATVGRLANLSEVDTPEKRFLAWILGCMLFGHAVTFFSVSYFDQTVVFFYFLLAAIGSVGGATLAPAAAVGSSVPINTETLAGYQAEWRG